MKKLTALILALLMLCSVAFAEETAAEEATATLDAEEIINFDVTMDEIPEGYAMSKEVVAGRTVLTFSNDSTFIGISVAYSDMFEGYTLKLAEMSEDDKAAMQAICSEGYSNPVFSETQTSHGTDLIVINESDVETDYADVFTIYEGYFINASMLKDSELTDDDLALAVKLLSDLWIVPAAN